MYEKHSLLSYLQRQDTAKLHLILLQELKKERRENATLILYILYILETRSPRFPPYITEAWKEYLQPTHQNSAS